jgi:hypothetical protein
MRKFLIFVTVLAYSHQLLGQFDQEKFERIFDQEVTDTKYTDRENHSGVYLNVAPQEVPAWFINPPVSDGNDVYAIGVSDPEMDSTEALDQAIYRAQVIANVLRKSTTQLLCDFFVNEVNHSSNVVYEHFSRINATIPISGVFELVNTFRNKFDETIVLMRYFPTDSMKPEQYDRIAMELYKNEIQSTAYGNFQSVFEIRVQPNTADRIDPMFYQLTELGTRYDVQSVYENQEKSMPIYKLSYTGIPNNDSATFSYFSHGLWKEYFKSVMIQIISKAREKPENIQYLGDAFQKNSYEKLTRGISINQMRFVVTGMSVFNNELKVAMRELPLGE